MASARDLAARAAASPALRTCAVVAASVLASVVTTALVARAGPGQASPPTLGFAGILTGVSGPTTLTFHFKKAGAEVACSPAARASSVSVDAETGAFFAQIPIGGCPASLFDGSAVTVDVDVGDTPSVAANQPIGAVPYAKYADQVGTPDCPVGYLRESIARAGAIACARGHDEIVRVGDGPSAFWIDRFEASVWDAAELQQSVASFPDSFPETAQVASRADLLHAVSRSGVHPTTSITWYQASLACLAAGKRLPTGPEWLLAATGTVDPDVSDGLDGSCLTDNTATNDGPRRSGAAHADTRCVSLWGAEDMIGNVGEWTAEWYAGLGVQSDASCTTCGGTSFDEHFAWPDGYAGDGTWNVASSAYLDHTGNTGPGLPAAALRGGHWAHGTRAGVFALNLHSAPSHLAPAVGFRCLTPR